MTTSMSLGSPEAQRFEIRHVPMNLPLEWLSRRWHDLKAIGTPGLAHGALIAILGAVLPAMLLWSALIVAVTAIGFLTILIGMVWVAPLLGYATWHAYRDLVA